MWSQNPWAEDFFDTAIIIKILSDNSLKKSVLANIGFVLLGNVTLFSFFSKQEFLWTTNFWFYSVKKVKSLKRAGSRVLSAFAILFNIFHQFAMHMVSAVVTATRVRWLAHRVMNFSRKNNPNFTGILPDFQRILRFCFFFSGGGVFCTEIFPKGHDEILWAS